MTILMLVLNTPPLITMTILRMMELEILMSNDATHHDDTVDTVDTVDNVNNDDTDDTVQEKSDLTNAVTTLQQNVKQEAQGGW